MIMVFSSLHLMGPVSCFDHVPGTPRNLITSGTSSWRESTGARLGFWQASSLFETTCIKYSKGYWAGAITNNSFN
jgi:hypothetical protein